MKHSITATLACLALAVPCLAQDQPPPGQAAKKEPTSSARQAVAAEKLKAALATQQIQAVQERRRAEEAEQRARAQADLLRQAEAEARRMAEAARDAEQRARHEAESARHEAEAVRQELLRALAVARQHGAAGSSKASGSARDALSVLDEERATLIRKHQAQRASLSQELHRLDAAQATELDRLEKRRAELLGGQGQASTATVRQAEVRFDQLLGRLAAIEDRLSQLEKAQAGAAKKARKATKPRK